MHDETARPEKDVQKEKKAHTLELFIVIMLGVTAWATWIGSIHGGNQAANFAQSNNLSALGNSMYNEGVQFMMQDVILYNEIMSLIIDQHFAEQRGDFDTYERVDWKIDQLMTHMTDEFFDAFMWSAEQAELLGETITPFMNEEFIDTYFAEANHFLEEAEEIFQQGMEDGTASDAFGLVTVFYTVSLFLLGITSTFHVERNKIIVLCIATTTFLIATVYMMFQPMPTDFSLGAFFG